MRAENSNSGAGEHGGAFATTLWSVVQAAGHGTASAAQPALEQLCRSYWYPLYAHVRCRGYSREDAEDLSQAFFGCLLREEVAQTVASPGEIDDELRHLIQVLGQ